MTPRLIHTSFPTTLSNCATKKRANQNRQMCSYESNYDMKCRILKNETRKFTQFIFLLVKLIYQN